MLFCEGPTDRARRDLPPELAAGGRGSRGAAGAAAAAPVGGAGARRRPADGGARPSSLKEAVRAETERVERELIQRALDETGGNVTQAARKLQDLAQEPADEDEGARACGPR